MKVVLVIVIMISDGLNFMVLIVNTKEGDEKFKDNDKKRNSSSFYMWRI